jgi:hypothetical protein
MYKNCFLYSNGSTKDQNSLFKSSSGLLVPNQKKEEALSKKNHTLEFVALSGEPPPLKYSKEKRKRIAS